MLLSKTNNLCIYTNTGSPTFNSNNCGGTSCIVSNEWRSWLMVNGDLTAVIPTILDARCANSEIALVTQGTALLNI